MANISVAELLFDADFCDPCTVLRQVETVGSDGIVTYTTQSIPILASIQAMGGDDLMVTPDLARTGGSYEVITTFPLATATNSSKADTVLWRGIEFVVTSIGRFGNFANSAGHYEGVMEIKTISPPAGPP
jgi:hypothetical protein